MTEIINKLAESYLHTQTQFLFSLLFKPFPLWMQSSKSETSFDSSSSSLSTLRYSIKKTKKKRRLTDDTRSKASKSISYLLQQVVDIKYDGQVRYLIFFFERWNDGQQVSIILTHCGIGQAASHVFRGKPLCATHKMRNECINEAQKRDEKESGTEIKRILSLMWAW